MCLDADFELTRYSLPGNGRVFVPYLLAMITAPPYLKQSFM